MANKAFEYYKGLPTWAKGVVVVGGLAVIYITAAQIIKKIRENKEQKKQMEEISAATNDLRNLAKNGIRPTLTKTELESISSAIIDAVAGCGTNMSKIFTQMGRLKNDADVLLLITVFGLRKKMRCVFSDDPREDFWSNMTPPMSLTAILQSDCSASDIADINKVLSKAGIKYKF